jgi:hypothetical protein
MSWNDIDNARRLKPGMTLKIYRESWNYESLKIPLPLLIKS